MAQRRFVVGTSPIIIAQENLNRVSLTITMLPTSIESGNTGRIHVGKGFVPSSDLSSSNVGDVLIQGVQIQEVEQFPGDPSLFKGQWWAVASIADQVLIVDEMLK